MQNLRIDVWSDIACPWCYVGKRHLETALAAVATRGDVEVVWRAFELDPSAPRVRPQTGSHAERIAKKYGMSIADAEARTAQMTRTAAADGIEFRFDRIQPGNTFDAHRLLHLAGEHGARLQDAVKERFLHGYLTDGEAIGQPDVLARLAHDAGLDATEVGAVLGGDRFATEVRADEAEARALGITGVPFFVFDGRLAVSGAQPAEVLAGALTRAWDTKAPEPTRFAEGAVCGPDGCA